MQLGTKVRDVITGVEGIVTGKVAYITGCSQVLIQPAAKDGAKVESMWCDVDRCETVDATPIVLPRTSNGADREAPKR